MIITVQFHEAPAASSSDSGFKSHLWSDEDKLSVGVAEGKIDDSLDGYVSAHRIHEHVELVHHSVSMLQCHRGGRRLRQQAQSQIIQHHQCLISAWGTMKKARSNMTWTVYQYMIF